MADNKITSGDYYITCNNGTGNVFFNANVDVTAGNVLAGNLNAVDALTAGNISVYANVIKSSSDIILDPSGDGAALTGNVIVLGNVSVEGNVTYYDISTSYTSNLLWVAAETANTAAQANTAGLAVGPIGAYYATLLYNQLANSWSSNIGIISPFMSVSGNIAADRINANVANIATANIGNLAIANVSTDALVANSANIAGNITGSYIIGNGAFLTGLPAGYSNADVANYLPTYTGDISASNITLSNNIAVTGNASVTGDINTFANVSAVGNVTGGNIISLGNVDVTANINAIGANISGNIHANNIIWDTSLLGNIISTTGDISTAANVSATGNITGNYIIGNGAFLTGLPAGYSNSDVANYLPTYTGDISASNITLSNNIAVTGNVSATGNVTGNMIIGNGALLTGITATTAATSATVTTNAQPNITSVGILTSLSVLGNIDGGNINTANVVSAGGNVNSGANINAVGANISGNVSSGNLLTSGTVSSTGNVTGGNVSTTGNVYGNAFIGSGAGLTGVKIPITNDVATSNVEYPIFASASTGNLTTAYTANTQLTFTPSTGVFTANVLATASGFVLNPTTIAASYSIPSGFNAASTGPITLGAGVVVTVPAGSSWSVS